MTAADRDLILMWLRYVEGYYEQQAERLADPACRMVAERQPTDVFAAARLTGEWASATATSRQARTLMAEGFFDHKEAFDRWATPTRLLHPTVRIWSGVLNQWVGVWERHRGVIADPDGLMDGPLHSSPVEHPTVIDVTLALTRSVRDIVTYCDALHRIEFLDAKIRAAGSALIHDDDPFR